MTFTLPPLAQAVSRDVFQWGRIESNTDWLLPVGALVAAAFFVRYLYRRDAVELSPVLGWLLTGLRLAAFGALLVLYLEPQWRTEREVISHSKVLMLVDTSSSMGLTDVDLSLPQGKPNRIGQVAEAFEQTDFLDRVRQTHNVVVLRFDEDIARVVSLDKLAASQAETAGTSDQEKAQPGTEPKGVDVDKIDWPKALSATGTETRLAEALRQLVYEERNSPAAGIIVFSDGRQNAGTPVEAAVDAAREANIQVFVVGVGSDRLPANVRVYQVEAPPRAYPGDPYSISGLIQTQGTLGESDATLAGKSLAVQLLVRDADEAGGKPGTGSLADSQEVTLGGPGESVSVTFEVTPEGTGRKTYCLRVVAPRTDQNSIDDYREVDVDVVDRKDRVLLLAGGPTRDYRFLRTQLVRDSSMTVDVLLQTGAEGMSQEADSLLDDFPATREEMFAYDCVTAFDPDWQALTAGQINLLEEWVDQQRGGLIVIAGAVYAGEAITGWIYDPAMEKIRDLYPVELNRTASILDSGSYGGGEPWPLDFTREGLESRTLWLDDTETGSLQSWGAFEGVYSHCPVRGPKSAATVLARFSDPRARQGDEQPVYFAEQFYGSGRVFYIGSGEMWRLRQLDSSYFERLYTSLIRHVSQGRLLRQSTRGVLMVGRDRYMLGATVQIQAQLTNGQLAPLDLPGVTLDVFNPDGHIQTITLRTDTGRAGTYSGQLTVLAEGTYKLELPVPESDERIGRRIHVTLPDLERQNPQRNSKLLAQIADEGQSGGKYYESLAEALKPGAADPLVERLKDRSRTVVFTTAGDPLMLIWLFNRSGMSAWIESSSLEQWWERPGVQYVLRNTPLWGMIAMLLICGLLCTEWLIRRLSKLA